VDFRILGPLEVSREGRPVTLGAQRHKALVCLLLVRANEVVSADRLVDELWRGAPPATARKALQVYVSRVRKALGAEVLETRAPGYVIRVEDGALDARRFERLVAEGRQALAGGDPARAAASLRKALALWRGPALADFVYEPFAQAEAGRLEELRLRCLEDRLEADLALGRHSDLVGELEALIDRHGSRERLCGQLMLALYRSGRQGEALDAYRQTRRRLVAELGIEPGPDLRSLERAILNQDPRLTFTPPPAVAAKAARPAGIFVGRDRELAELTGALDDVPRGRGSLFLLSGEPGIGKTRLAEEVAARASERGARVLSGRCWESGGAPAYWPWVQCLRVLVQEPEPATLAAQVGAGAADIAQIVPELHELLPDLRGPPPSVDPDGARFRLFEAITTFVRNAAGAQPIVLILEDFHAADASSLLLLRFVAGDLADAPVLVVVTVRDGDRASTEAFASNLAELVRSATVSHLPLQGLEREDVARLVQAGHGIDASEGLVAAIHERTDGHPLFVGEILRLLASEGRLDALPHEVRAVVGQRLGLLSRDCRQVLAVASVVGREFGTDVLARVSEVDPASLPDLLDEAIAARALAEVPGAVGRLRFAHALVREVLYDELPASRRMRLHRRVGDALEAIHAAELEPRLAALAHHFVLAAPIGAAAKAVDYSTRAAERAVAELAYEESVRLYEMALRAHELQAGTDEQTRCDLLLARGDAQTRSGDTGSARETFLRAADIARSAGMGERLARAALGYGGRFVSLPEDDARLLPLLEEALTALGEDDDALRARLLARLACARPYWGGSLTSRRRASAARSLEAVELARRLDDRATLAWALEARSVVLWGPDNVDELLVLSDEIVTLADAAGECEQAVNAHAMRSEVLLALGELPAARADLEAAARLAQELRLPSQRWHVAVHQIGLALLAGRFPEAQQLIERANRFGERAHRAEATWCAVVQRFPLLLEQGGLEEIRPALEALAAERPDETLLRCLLARLECELGHETQARATLELLARDGFAALTKDLSWLLAIALLAEVAALVGDAQRAALLYELLGPYASLVAGSPHCFTVGSASRYLGLLASVLSRPDEAVRHLEDAAAMNEKIAARPWHAHTKADHARVLLARDASGDRERAGDLLRDALSTYQELGMTASAGKVSTRLRQLAAQPLPETGAGPPRDVVPPRA
jgi:DNA-binding SARP family transcriptional activator/tetratricopeptide (TPR) repeat protein